MSPDTDAHPYALDEPLARTILGERSHLSAYEVKRMEDYRGHKVLMWRPSLVEEPGYKANNQVHLCSEEDDAYEAECMRAYYWWKHPARQYGRPSRLDLWFMQQLCP